MTPDILFNERSLHIVGPATTYEQFSFPVKQQLVLNTDRNPIIVEAVHGKTGLSLFIGDDTSNPDNSIVCNPSLTVDVLNRDIKEDVHGAAAYKREQKAARKHQQSIDHKRGKL